MSTLLHLKGCLKGPTRSHSKGDNTKKIIKNLRTRYDTPSQKTKGRLLGLTPDPQGPVFDFAIEVVTLVGLAHSYLPSEEQDTLSVDYVIREMHNTVLQRHFLTTITITVEFLAS